MTRAQVTRALALPVVIAVAVGLAACGARGTPSNNKAPEAGISLALYADGNTRYGVVDDRRWIEIKGASILLDNIDPGASLASLVIEPSNASVRIGPCTRDRLPDLPRDPLKEYAEEEARLAHERALRRIRRRLPNATDPLEPRAEPEVKADSKERFAPIVACDVDGPPGRYLVRIVYVSTTLTYRAQHDIEVTAPDRAAIASRFAVVTPPWRQRANVIVYDGAPGGDKPPAEIVRGDVTLDGGTSVLVVPTREVNARVRRIFQNKLVDDEAENDAELWAPEGLPAIWATLEMPETKLPPGPVRVHVELADDGPHWIDVPDARRPKPRTREGTSTDTAPLRLPLWVDGNLHGTRQRQVIDNDGVRMVEMFVVTITNTGDTAREVWVEEQLRPAKRRTVERAWPKKPVSSAGDVVRNKLEVRPGRVERAGYTVVYEL